MSRNVLVASSVLSCAILSWSRPVTAQILQLERVTTTSVHSMGLFVDGRMDIPPGTVVSYETKLLNADGSVRDVRGGSSDHSSLGAADGLLPGWGSGAVLGQTSVGTAGQVTATVGANGNGTELVFEGLRYDLPATTGSAEFIWRHAKIGGGAIFDEVRCTISATADSVAVEQIAPLVVTDGNRGSIEGEFFAPILSTGTWSLSCTAPDGALEESGQFSVAKTPTITVNRNSPLDGPPETASGSLSIMFTPEQSASRPYIGQLGHRRVEVYVWQTAIEDRWRYFLPGSLYPCCGAGQYPNQIDYMASMAVGDSSPLIRADFNADGRVDAADYAIFRDEVLQLIPGDADLNGRFDSADLVQVFRIGEYEDRRTKNSVWADGDWNGDREFDTTDLVVAFQAGAYEAQAASVPEPRFALVMLGIVLLIYPARRLVSPRGVLGECRRIEDP